MKLKLISNKFKLALTSLAAVASLFFMAASPVYASQIGPLKAPAVSSKYTDDHLSALFQHDQSLFYRLRDEIKLASSKTAPSMRLTNEKGSGLQKTEQDLSIDKIALSRAEALQNDIQSVISAHAGFDTEETVTNHTTAINTLNSLDTFLRNADFWVGQANREYSNALIAR
jgi:hypothetical protein